MTFKNVQENDWIQPYKRLYTMADFKRLCKTHTAKTARFILMCSSAYYFIDEKKECDVSKALHKMRVDML